MNNPPEMRFGFGRNWQQFVRRNFNRERCEIAKQRLLRFAGRDSLAGVDFLDVGCGSGLHSLAAHEAGARRVFSFDYDPNSVEASKFLWRYAGCPANWQIERGDALDTGYVENLGKWAFVYSWGVLHHTGDVWQAIRNVQATVADEGYYYVALYSADVQPQKEFWLDIKRKYNESGWATRERLTWWYIWEYCLNKDFRKVPSFVSRVLGYRKQRGMNLFTDVRDWLGGWPMEFVYDQDVVDLLEKDYQFALTNIATGEACTEFLFKRMASRQMQRTIVADFVAGGHTDAGELAGSTSTAS